MTRSKCTIMVDKDTVKRLIKFQYGTVANFASKYGVSRMRLWQIVNEPHVSADNPSIKKLARMLMTTTRSITKEILK